MQDATNIADIKAMSLAEACASVGKRPEQFPANKRCACGCILSRYNSYDSCSMCRRAVRNAKLKEINGALPRTKNGHVYWSVAVVVFTERTPLPQHRQLRENIFAK